jgi:hypothetical protein
MFYVATIYKSDKIFLFGCGETPELALEDFEFGGDFEEYCYINKITSEVEIIVSVWKACEVDEIFDEDDISFIESEGFDWMIIDEKPVAKKIMKSKLVELTRGNENE